MGLARQPLAENLGGGEGRQAWGREGLGRWLPVSGSYRKAWNIWLRAFRRVRMEGRWGDSVARWGFGGEQGPL